MSLSQISTQFKTFSNRECKNSSELYAYLALKTAEDDELLALSAHAQTGQPVPNLFFGAVHYLLLKGKDHALKEYYPSIVENQGKATESFTSFKHFCEVNREEIILLLESKLVQTNEIRRCTYLYPAFCRIYQAINKPLALIEIGTSAGFQLMWDTYSYSYQTNEIYGNQSGEVQLTAEIKGDNNPELLLKSPPVTSRIGLDLHVNDIRNKEDSLWLNALIWPEHEERRKLFKQAVANVSKNRDKLELIESDGVELLPEVAQQVPEESVICIFHTHAANQMPENVRNELLEKVRKIGNQRDVFHLYNNLWDRDLHLDACIAGVEHNEVIAETDGHGRWFSWKV